MIRKNASKQNKDALHNKLEELKKLISSKIYANPTYYNLYFTKWRSSTEYLLGAIFGEKSIQLKNFKSAVKLPGGKAIKSDWARLKLSAMQRAAAELQAMISMPDEVEKPMSPRPQRAPAVFIAHGGKTEALEKLQGFVRALGVNPLVAEQEASGGRSVDKHIEWCLKNADCAIVLGTADDENLKDGKLYPRPNVHIEIGRIQERFDSRVVYLLEQKASFPSNISEKVYERFTQQNMEMAFIKIAREFMAFEILHAAIIVI